MPINYPTSLDTLANPGPTTNQDDTGYELDVVISKLNDIAEALEAKLGTGADTATQNDVLVGSGAGASAWAPVTWPNLAANTIHQISSVVGTDSSPHTTSASPVDLNQMSITLTPDVGTVLMLFDGSFYNATPGSALYVNFSVGGVSSTVRSATMATANAAYSVGVHRLFSGLATGSPIVFKVQWSTSGGDVYNAGLERRLTVVEFRR